MKVKIKRLHEDATIPKYQTAGASGFDLHALEDVEIKPGYTVLIQTGLSFQVPKGYELQVRPRSGLSLKTKLRVANSPGTVDSDYTGEVCIIVTNTDNCLEDLIKYKHQPEEILFDIINQHTISISAGDRIAQGVVCPIEQVELEEVDELETTKRGSGGFGSTNG